MASRNIFFRMSPGSSYTSISRPRCEQFFFFILPFEVNFPTSVFRKFKIFKNFMTLVENSPLLVILSDLVFSLSSIEIFLSGVGVFIFPRENFFKQYRSFHFEATRIKFYTETKFHFSRLGFYFFTLAGSD